jgi:hypothetical protein
MSTHALAPTVADVVCDYCDQPAALIGRDSGDVLCRSCGRDQYADLRHSLAKLTPTTGRRYNPSRFDEGAATR